MMKLKTDFVKRTLQFCGTTCSIKLWSELPDDLYIMYVEQKIQTVLSIRCRHAAMDYH